MKKHLLSIILVMVAVCTQAAVTIPVFSTGTYNYIYNGNFTLSENDGAPAGWIGSDNVLGNTTGKYHARTYVVTSGDNFKYLSIFSNEATRACFYMRFDGNGSSTDTSSKNTVYTYGTIKNYSLSLKKDTLYRFTFDAGAWSNNESYNGRSIKVYVKDATGNIVGSQTLPLTLVMGNKATKTSGAITFVAPSTGNYTINFANADVSKELAIVVTNCAFAPASASTPILNATGPTYYFIKFLNNSYVCNAIGENQNLINNEIEPTDSKMWKLQGNRESFNIQSKSGLNVYFDNTENKYITSTTKATTFQLVSNTSKYAPCWEIHRKSEGTTGKGICATTDSTIISETNLNNDNNAISFEELNSKLFTEYKINGIKDYRPQNKYTLWYTHPSSNQGVEDPWMEYALPIGNGQFGGMVYGDIQTENIQFNEKTLWKGDSKKGNSTNQGCYLDFGRIIIENNDNTFGYTSTNSVQDYIRQLDLSNATASVSYKSPDRRTTYTREYISSYPDGVMAIRLKASTKGQINVKVSLKGANTKDVVAYTNDAASITGKSTIVSYHAKLKVLPSGGTVTKDNNTLVISGADELLIALAGGTDFDLNSSTWISNTSSFATDIDARADAAVIKGWNNLYTAHVADYQKLFNRMSVTLNDAENTLDTESLLKEYNKNEASSSITQMLEMLYFQYGRYLLISSSRGVSSPANLQGIWNHSNNPPWTCDIHSNINVEENYWLAENTNLSELHNIFLDYIHNGVTKHTIWRDNAKQVYKSLNKVDYSSNRDPGWVVFTRNNIFNGTDYSFRQNACINNAWFCMHFWQHYRYTLDKQFLKEKAMPVLISCCNFWLQRLITAKDGTLECPKEFSPEHGPSEQNGVAHAQQLVWDLFNNTLQAINVLGSEAAETGATDAFVSELKDKFNRMDKGLHTEVVNSGANVASCNGKTFLREWKYSPYSVGTKGHRHLSHLIGLYPGNQISKDINKTIFDAAVVSLTDRGDAATGWSLGWKMNLWARALDGEHAHFMLRQGLRHATSYKSPEGSSDVYYEGGGVYYNLFDSHSPFQIDGNFSMTAGVVELLLQSYTDTIQLLPALPSQWKTGSMKGAKAIGNFTIDLAWKDSKLIDANVLSISGKDCIISYPGISNATITNNGVAYNFTKISNDRIKISTIANQSYKINMNETTVDVKPLTQANDFNIKVKGRQVTVLGNNFRSIKINDIDGKLLLYTTHNSFIVPSSSDIILLSIINSKKQETQQKIVLK